MKTVRGREAETGAALLRFKEVEDRQRGEVIEVRGPLGSGVRALTAEVAEQCRRRGARVAFAQAADPWPSGDGDGLQHVRPAYSAVLNVLTGGAHPVLSWEDLAAHERLFERPPWLVEQFAQALLQACQDSPVVLAIDQAQWMDTESAYVFRELSARLADQPILWLTGSHSGRERGEPSGRNRSMPMADSQLPTLHLVLGRVSDAALEALTTDRTGRRQLTDRDRRLVALADGWPGVLARLLDAAHDAPTAASTGAPSDAPRDTLPESFTRWVVGRLECDLTRFEREQLTLAAVLSEFYVEDLAAVAGVDQRYAMSSLQPLLRLGVLGEDVDRVKFLCEAVRQAVYEATSGPERRLLHQRAVRVLSAAGRSALEQSLHVRAVALPGDVEAAATLRRAAAEANGNTEVELLRDAVALSDGDGRASVTVELISALCRAGRLREAVLEFDRTWADHPDVCLLVAAAPALWATGRRAELVDACRAHLESQHEENTAAALAAIVLADESRCGRDASRRAVVSAQTGPASKWLARARGYASLWGGDNVSAAAAFREAADVFVECAVEELQAQAGRLVDAPADLGGPDAAHGESESAFEVARRAAHALSRGRLSQAQELAGQAAALAEAPEHIDVLAFATSVDARASLLRGDVDRAAALASRLPDGASGAGERALHVRVLLARAAGECGRAEELVATGLADAPQALLDPDFLVTAAQVTAGSSNGLELAVRAVARRIGEGEPFAGAVASYVRALEVDTVESLTSAATLARQVDRPVTAADMLEDLGCRLLDIGHREEAVHALDAAWDLYHAAGADAGASRVRRRLSQAGVRRRRWQPVPARASAGWESLTDSERKVAVLASHGYSNRDVAERLTVSPNTVATHLRAVYTKLGVNKRVHLARLVLERAEPVAEQVAG